MKEIFLDGKMLQRSEEGHIYLMKKFNFPAYYGENLDALYDLLTEIGEALEIYIENAEMMDSRIKRVFEDAVLDNECLVLNFSKINN